MFYLKSKINNIFFHKKPKIFGKNGFLKQSVESFLSVRRGYRPTIWCFAAIPNVFAHKILQKQIIQKYERYSKLCFRKLQDIEILYSCTMISAH
jgi:hypothetical protein